MPTILIEQGFQFFFYATEHEPMHVHVLKAEEFAKINLVTLEVVDNYMKPASLKKALAIAKLHKDQFRRAWNEYFNKR
jgi:hypothetical protein